MNRNVEFGKYIKKTQSDCIFEILRGDWPNLKETGFFMGVIYLDNCLNEPFGRNCFDKQFTPHLSLAFRCFISRFMK